MNINDKKGIDIARGFFKEQLSKSAKEHFQKEYEYMTFGLVGEGSECYGYDDELSKDHDFGISQTIWFPSEFGYCKNDVLDLLKNEAKIYQEKNGLKYDLGRKNVFEIDDFYEHYTNMRELPRTLKQWTSIPLQNLSVATNGEIFKVGKGDFVEKRDYLKAFPKDAKLKSISFHLAIAAQTGQYNFPRLLERGDYISAYIVLGKYVEEIAKVSILMADKYPPFYKWLIKAAKETSVAWHKIEPIVSELIKTNLMTHGSIALINIEKIAYLIIDELKKYNMSSSNDAFLLEHANQVLGCADSREVKNSNLWSERL